MENWQKQFINENLPELITSIRCDVVFLAYLLKYGALSPVQMDSLISIPGGEVSKASALIHILQGQVKAYGHLAKALQKSNQTGGLNILLKGIQQHLLLRNVFFGGARISLQNICKSIDKESLQNIIANEVNADTYEQFLNPEPWTLTREIFPNSLQYYIPRTLSINTQIDAEIFQKLEKDIFCIEGMELYQMSNLASKKGKENSRAARNMPDRSRNQIHGVTTRFILLERHDHFSDIARETTRPVHWLRYSVGNYYYVKSSPGCEVKNASKFLVSKSVKYVNEEEFIERCVNIPGNEPVFIYDSPGMGKSILLANLARKVKEKRPEDSVIHFEISELVRKVHQVNESCSSAAIKQALVENIAVDGLGHKILENLFDSNEHQIFIFLDGYDEVLQNDSSDANKILGILVNETRNIQIFAATRPHKQKELEEKFGVLGFNILPFNHSNKLSFFLKYWQSEHGIEITDEIIHFAEHCLNRVACEISSKESDIAGIPLQCRMLAEIYAEDAKRGGLIPTESQIQLNSIFKVYRHFIDTKFSTFCCDAEKELYYDFHVREAVRTLFPDESKNIHNDAPIPDHDLIYRIGILEPLMSASSTPIFSHRTLAEYFAAEFLAISATSNLFMNLSESDFIDLFFENALMWSFQYLGRIFHNPVFCRFLNFFISNQQSYGQAANSVTRALKESSSYNSETLMGLLESSLRINAVYLYLYLLEIYLDLDTSTYKTDAVLTLKETQHWQDTKTQHLVNSLKRGSHFQDLVAIAAEVSSLNLVELSCEFLECVTGKQVHEIPYFQRGHPIYFALRRGHFQIFEYLLSFDREKFYNKPLLHWCLQESAGSKNVADRVQILRMILNERPDLLDESRPPDYDYEPLHEYKVHFELIKILIEAGAWLHNFNDASENIAHKAAYYFSAEEYHELIQLLISHNKRWILWESDWAGLTPGHLALKWIDLKSETLEILKNTCHVYFNGKYRGKQSELATAIRHNRSQRVINEIIRLGGDIDKLDAKDREKLAINYNI